MEKNENPNIVVMDKDIYQKLLSAARIGAAEQNLDLKPILKHVAKFNVVQKRLNQLARECNRTTFVELRDKVRDLLKRKQGKTVYYRQTENHYLLVTLVGPAPNSKIAVRVKGMPGSLVGPSDSGWVCFPTAIDEHVDPYWMLVREGPYKGAYVPPNTFR